MKNKLIENSNGYSIDKHEIIYVQSKIEDIVLKHIFAKLKKTSKRSFITIEKIFEILGLIFDDSNQRINVMKTFKRFKQTSSFKEFITFGTEFQRLTIDAKMNDIETLLKDLKNKMSYDLQKTMIVDVYESKNLYEFAKKCQFMNQTFRNVKNRSKYNRSKNIDKIITISENVTFAINKTIISIVVLSSYRQITSTSKLVIAPTNQFKKIN